MSGPVFWTTELGDLNPIGLGQHQAARQIGDFMVKFSLRPRMHLFTGVDDRKAQVLGFGLYVALHARRKGRHGNRLP
jgi:hypothetical protein